jgi:hypothetical protein
VFLASAVGGLGTPRLPPVDEAPRDPSFHTFRRVLLRAIARRDARHLYRVTDPKIMFSFGDDPGREGFWRQWRPERRDSKLWGELQRVLSLGGSFDTVEGRRHFSAPYVFSKWPDRYDDFAHVAVTGRDVALRSRPVHRAPVLARLDYDIVRIKDGTATKGSPSAWVPVTTMAGRSGYVQGRFLRSPTDYRAGFEKRQGQWRMTFFVAGD